MLVCSCISLSPLSTAATAALLFPWSGAAGVENCVFDVEREGVASSNSISKLGNRRSTSLGGQDQLSSPAILLREMICLHKGSEVTFHFLGRI